MNEQTTADLLAEVREQRVMLKHQARGLIADQAVCWVSGMMTAAGAVMAVVVPSSGWLGPVVGLLGSGLFLTMTIAAIQVAEEARNDQFRTHPGR